MKSVVPIEYHSTNLNLHRCWDGDMGRSDMPLGFSSGHLPSLMFCLWAYRSPECSTVNSGIPETPLYTCSVSVIALATNLQHPTSTRQSLAALHRLQAQPLPLKWLVHSILPRHCYLCQSRHRTESWTCQHFPVLGWIKLSSLCPWRELFPFRNISQNKLLVFIIFCQYTFSTSLSGIEIGLEMIFTRIILSWHGYI